MIPDNARLTKAEWNIVAKHQKRIEELQTCYKNPNAELVVKIRTPDPAGRAHYEFVSLDVSAKFLDSTIKYQIEKLEEAILSVINGASQIR